MQWCDTNNHARERARRQSGPPTALTLPDRALTWNGRALFSWRIDRRATRLDEQFVPRASRSGWLCVSRVRFLAASAARRTRWRASAVSPCFEITSGILLDAPRRELPSGARRALSARTRSRNPENQVPPLSLPRRLTRVLSTQVLVLTVWSWLSVESFRLSGARRASSSGSRVGDEELTSATRSSHIIRRATNGGNLGIRDDPRRVLPSGLALRFGARTSTVRRRMMSGRPGRRTAQVACASRIENADGARRVAAMPGCCAASRARRRRAVVSSCNSASAMLRPGPWLQ